MPRLSLWRPEYSKDYYWHDRQCREYFYVGGIGIIAVSYTHLTLPTNREV